MTFKGSMSKLLCNEEGRECSVCGEFKPWGEYPLAPGGRHINDRQSYCKSCKSDKYKAGKALVNSFKDKPCADCGAQYAPQLMDFDHVRGKKLFNVSMGFSHSLDSLLKEIEKCDLVCCLCHRTRTWNRKHPEDPISREPL